MEAEQLRQAEVRQAAERRKEEAIELEKRYQKESLVIQRAEVSGENLALFLVSGGWLQGCWHPQPRAFFSNTTDSIIASPYF
jgi:hypothetical protein